MDTCGNLRGGRALQIHLPWQVLQYLACIQVPTGTIEPPCTVKLLPSETVSIIHALNILYHSVDSFICLMLHYKQ